MEIQQTNEKLVFKFSFLNPLFLEHELILNWNLSNKILITCFDLLKDDHLILRLQRKGQSFKEYLHERGFNQDVLIICDTGIFEFEVKKAKLNIDVPIYDVFSNDDIFKAYELIDPDFLVAPDEIILQTDKPDQLQAKLKKMTQNVSKTLELFPKKKIIPVLHGFSTETMTSYLDFLYSEKFSLIARGGLIPLWNESKLKFSEVITESEYLVRQYFAKIHSFGLPSLYALKDFFYYNSYDSLDTSIIYYRTAQRKYLIDKGYFISVRNAYFRRCGCSGCQLMEKTTYKPNSSDFTIGLYYHNCQKLVKLVNNIKHDPNIFDLGDSKRKTPTRKKFGFTTGNEQISLINSFISADKLVFQKEKSTTLFISKKHVNIEKLSIKILVISACSKEKSLYPKNILSLSDLRTVEQRRMVLESDIEKFEAKNLYSSERIKLVNSTVYELRTICDRVDLFFLSAGFGLINENTFIPSYDVTFSNKTGTEVKQMAQDLGLEQSIKSLPNHYDIIFLDLSQQYLQALYPYTTLLSKTKELVVFNSKQVLDNRLINADENYLRRIDLITTYLPFELQKFTRISLLKNYYIFLAHQEQLGIILSLKRWIEKIMPLEKENKYVLRAY